MNDFEDDSDGELPSISLSQSTGIKTEFEMPPAEVVVSQREREAAVERDLQKLRDAEAAAAAELEARRAHRDCQTLSSGVTALEVSEVSEDMQRQVEELTVMAPHLPEADAAFLTAYTQALKDSPNVAGAITKQVVSGICLALTRGACLSGGAVAAAAVLLTVPPAPRTRRALHAILDRVASPEQVDALIAGGVRGVRGVRGAARRLAAHDAARSGAGRGADRLARALLAHAVHEILHGSECSDPPAPLSPATAEAVRAHFRHLPAHKQLLLLRGAGRALAGGAGGEGGALLHALAQPLPRVIHTKADDDNTRIDVSLRHQVLANVTKLQLLFGERPSQMDRIEVDESKKPANGRTEADNENAKSQTEKEIVDKEVVPISELDKVNMKNDHEDGVNPYKATTVPRTPENEVKEERPDAMDSIDPETLELKKEVKEAEVSHKATTDLPRTPENLPVKEESNAMVWVDPEKDLELKKEVKGAKEVKEAEEVKEAIEVDSGSSQRVATRRSPRVAARLRDQRT